MMPNVHAFFDPQANQWCTHFVGSNLHKKPLKAAPYDHFQTSNTARQFFTSSFSPYNSYCRPPRTDSLAMLPNGSACHLNTSNGTNGFLCVVPFATRAQEIDRQIKASAREYIDGTIQNGGLPATGPWPLDNKNNRSGYLLGFLGQKNFSRIKRLVPIVSIRHPHFLLLAGLCTCGNFGESCALLLPRENS
jgi:hypothetical protein